MNRLVARSLEILGQATKEMGQEYTSNLTSFINDAKDVKNSIVKSTTDASDTFAKLKNTNITKKISDWFYQEENSYDASSGEEFDAGFKIDSSDDPKLDGEKKSSELSVDSMRDITEKQTNTLLKIGRRQTEQSVANTAEIISVVNSRTSEMIASMNNINKSLIGISDRLDKLIKLQTVEIEETKAEDKGGLYSDGNLSLMRIFEAAKQNMSNNSVVSTASMLGQLFMNGAGPVEVAKLIMGFGTSKPMDILGGRSIDEIGKKFNDMIGTATQTAMNEIINSKPFKKFFGDITSFTGNTDYGTIATTTYNTKKAQFDGMTRMSIVNIIPEYLNKINQALTGETYHVDNRGKLVKGPAQNKFAEVTQNAFASSGLSSNAQKSILAAGTRTLGTKISSADIDIAGKALTGSIVMYMENQGQRSFTITELKGDMTPFIISAVKVLCLTGKNDPEYWATVCQTIILQLSSGLMDSSQFVHNINKSLENTMSAASSFALSGKPEALQATALSHNMMANEFIRLNKTTSSNPEVIPQQTSSQNTTKHGSRKVRVERTDADYIDGKHTQADFIRGIFGILNRGINVKVLNKKDPSWYFPNYDLGRISTKQEILDNTAGELFGSVIAGGVKSDNKLFQKVIKQGMANAATGFLGAEGSSGNVVSNGGDTVAKRVMELTMSSAISGVLKSLFNGSFKDDAAKFFSADGAGGKFISNADKKITNVANNIRDTEIGQSLAHDSRYIKAKDYIVNDIIMSLADKVKTTTGNVAEKVGNSNVYKNAYRTLNNGVYTAQSMSMNRSFNKLKNIDTTTIYDYEDRLHAENSLYSFAQGDLDQAAKHASGIKDKGLRNMFISNLENISNISKRRIDGESKIAEGELPSIGDALQGKIVTTQNDLDKSNERGGMKSLVFSGFKFIGGILGKIAKFIRNGFLNVAYGTKSIFEGIFGGKRIDKYGNVMRDENGKAIRSHGLLELATIDPVKISVLAIKELLANPAVKNVLSGVSEGISVAGNKILDTTVTGKKYFDEKGKPIRDENGKLIMDEVRSVRDLIRNPGKVLAETLQNISEEIKKSDVGKLFTKIGDGLKKLGLTKDDKEKGSFRDKIESLTENSEFLNRFFLGFTQGFDAVSGWRKKRQARKDAQERKSTYTTRTLGNIFDWLTGKANDANSFSGILHDALKPIQNSIEDTDDANKAEKPKEAPDKEYTDDQPTRKSIIGKILERISNSNNAVTKSGPFRLLKNCFDKLTKEVTGLRKDTKESAEVIADEVKDTGKDTVKAVEKVETAVERDDKPSKSGMDDISDILNKSKMDDIAGMLKGGDLGKMLGGNKSGDNSGSMMDSVVGLASNTFGDMMSASLELTFPGGGSLGSSLGNLGNLGNAAGSAEAGAAAGAAGAGAGAAAGGSGGVIELVVQRILDAVEAVGKILGGVLQFMKGIGQLVLSAVTAMESFKAIKELVGSILTEGVKPLNEAFKDIKRSLEPIVDVLTELMEDIFVTINDIFEAMIVTFKPLLDGIKPLIRTLIDDFFDPLLKDFMTPIVLALDVITPIMESMLHFIQIVAGAIEIGFGDTLSAIGLLQSGLGVIATGLGSLLGPFGSKIKQYGEDMRDSGSQLVKDGQNMVSSGFGLIGEGISGYVNMTKELITGKYDPNKYSDDEKTETKINTDDVNLHEEFGAGDVSNVYNTWTYTYGSGNTTMNQHSYGSYMNMSERGCGPVALADAFNRRSGGYISPTTLASTMMGAGSYSPSRGTSVGSMIGISGAMGMPVKMGGVTRESLRQASPNNPITVLGSGTGFGTKHGNNHYVNVVGTDSNGGAYVSNPLSGRVERQSATAIALNSKLALYGSGDDDVDYGFGRETTRAMDRLRELTDQLTGMFVDSNSTYIRKKREENENEQKAKTIMNRIGDKYDSVKEQVMQDLMSQNPKRDGEDDTAYRERIEAMVSSPEGYKLIIKYGGQEALSTAEDIATKTKDSISGIAGTFKDVVNKIAGWDLSDDDGQFTANNATLASYSPIRYTEPQIDAATSGKSPIHDFFSATSGSNAYTIDGGWFNRTDAPVSREGVGSKGDPHEGITISFSNPNDAELHAITGGTVSYVGRHGAHGGTDPNGGLGNHVKWRDESGMYHWYMHLADIDKNIQEGSNLEPGQLIGHVGDTGDSGDKNGNALKVLRYVLTKSGPYGNTGDDGYVNPLTYWKFEEGGKNADGFEKTDSMRGSYWSSAYEQKLANSQYHQQATKAGLTGAQEAMIAAIGIHEDSARKLTGEKSITKVTADYKGQTAFGIMNWIPDPANRYVGAEETKYGTTLAEQLPIMRRFYFDKNPEHDRAKIVNYTQYASALQRAMGHAPTLKQGDAWGPIAETDIAESMGHYVANALVPEGWNTAETLGKHMGTAVDAYNWMVKKGWIKTGGGSNSANQGDEGRIGRFVSTINNLSSGDGYFSSDSGAIMANYGVPTITSVNITSPTSGQSPVHEFFSKTTGVNAMSGPTGNWFRYRNNPNSMGEGSGGDPHSGIDIWWNDGKTEGKELHAITGGRVDQAQGGGFNGSSSNGGLGNNVRWVDDSGQYYHWYMHMQNTPLVREGDRIEPGQLLGYAGDTGNSFGAHLHYNINKISEFSGWSSNGAVNPLTYFRNYNSSGPNNGNSSANRRGGFTNAKVRSGYTGEGPFQFGDTGRDTSNTSSPSIIGPVMPDNLRGSGDWFDTIFAKDNVQTDVPPIDPSRFDAVDSTGMTTLQQFVQKYEVKADNSEQTKMLDKMSKMTFNVRAQRVEELLEELIEKLTGDKPDKSPSTDGYDPNLFENNGIPEPITRLSKG